MQGILRRRGRRRSRRISIVEETKKRPRTEEKKEMKMKKIYGDSDDYECDEQVQFGCF